MADGARKVLDLLKLDGKVAYVTGGGSGLGEAMAKALAQAGSAVACIDLNLPSAERVAAEIKKDGGEAIAIECDVTKPAAVAAALQQVVKAFGRLDIAVNNAGVGGSMPSVEETEANWRRVIEIDINSVFFCAQEAGKIMIAQGRGGAIINTASMSGSIINKGFPIASYCTAKAAVKHMTKALAVEWVKYGIRVNSISPGYMETPMIANAIKDPKVLDNMTSTTPMARLGQPWELGGLVVYLASEASSYMTGHDAVIDGGHSVW